MTEHKHLGSTGITGGRLREVDAGKSKTINALQICAEIADTARLDEHLKTIRSLFMQWAAQVLQLDITKTPAPVAVESSGGSLEEISVEQEKVWAARLHERGKRQGHELIHEVEVIPRAGGATLTYRQTITKFHGLEHKAERITPAFIYEIASKVKLQDAGHAIDGNTWIIENEADIEEFHAFLTSNERQLPVYMVTETRRSNNEYNTLIDFDSLAKRCLGVAHVALMSYDMGYVWTERVGKWLSAYLGTVRTYQPGISLLENDRNKHPLAMPERIVNWEHEGLRGPDAFGRFLEVQAMQGSAAQQNWRERFVPLSSLKAKAMAGEFEISEDAHWSAQEKRYQRKISLLESRIMETTQETIALAAENGKLKSDNAQLVSRIYQLERSLNQRQPVASAESAPQNTANMQDFLYVIEEFLILTDDAYDDLMESAPGAPQSLAQQALNLLANDVRKAFMEKKDVVQSREIRRKLEAIGGEILFDFDNPPVFSNPETNDEFIARYTLVCQNKQATATILFDFDANSDLVTIGRFSG